MSDDCAPDCDERTNCERVGVPGHWQCGECPEHNMPRHHCGCLAMTAAADRENRTGEGNRDE